MKMFQGLFLVGLSAAAGASYFFDGSEGGKRRRRAGKQLEQAVRATNSVVDNYSGQIRSAVSNLMKKDTSEWVPSPRLAGALGSVLAVYNSGRRGPAGTLLRILTLGLFARAFMTSNNGDVSIKERPESQKVHPSVYAESRS